MTTTRTETVPATWSDSRDVPFFRITARLFTPAFCFGASVLLASYDDTLGTPNASAATQRDSAAATPVSSHTQIERGLTPARVRRPR